LVPAVAAVPDFAIAARGHVMTLVNNLLIDGHEFMTTLRALFHYSSPSFWVPGLESAIRLTSFSLENKNPFSFEKGLRLFN